MNKQPVSIAFRYTKFHILPLILLFVACRNIDNATPNPITEPALLGSNDCQPPCWNGIFPGITPENEAISKLGTLEDIGEGELEIDRQNDTLQWIAANGQKYSITIVAEIATKISYFIDTETKTVRLDEIIAHFGEPAGYLTIYAPHPGEPVRIRTYYPDQGLMLFFFAENNKALSPGMFLVQVNMIAASDNLHEFYDTYELSFGKPTPEGPTPTILEWEGYGPFSE